MQHLDEGTVHAWLDGELSEAESAAAAQHVAECAQCAELVAEARGLIAGASRVVAALDAGPVGVIPRAKPATSAGFWRRLTRSPSRMAMAATILVAVGVTLTVRRAPHDGTSARPAIDETPALVSAPAAPPATATGAPAVRDQAAFVGGARKQSATSGGGSAATALADKKKDADARRDQPAPPALLSDLERAKAAPAAKTLAEVRPQIQAAPPLASRDSLAMRQGLTKVTADSVAARSPAPTVRRLEAAASAAQMREAGAQSQISRAAALDAINEISFQGCYRLSVDTTTWQGLLPASFVLVGSPSPAPGVAGGQARPAAPVSSNAVQAFAQKPELTGFGVHAIGANGQADSTLIGDWTTVGPTTARVRFLNTTQSRLVTVFISTGSPVARVTAGDRTDSLRVARIVCPR